MNPSQRPTAPNDVAPPFKPDIVRNIPLHHAAPAPVKDEDDLDRIIHDISHDLKKVGHPAKKKHWFTKKSPVSKTAPHPAPAAQHQSHPTQLPPKVQPAPASKKSPTPVLIVVATIIVTGLLIAAAFASYKK